MSEVNRKDPIQHLIDEFMGLPGIGPKSAQRLVFYLLRQPQSVSDELSGAINRLKGSISLCAICNNITDVDPCRICSDQSRDVKIICIVEEPFNIMSIERSRGYRGHYHVLHGTISPLNGIGPEELRLKNLIPRLEGNGVEEIIVATNPTSEGEVTALYLSRLLKPLGVRITRIASGLPVGSDLEYADGETISRALSGRREY
ncbi:MAG: recombination mediator RecR [Acidobacteriota bacterium]